MFSTQCTEPSSFCEDSPTERRERKKWTVTDDLVLISAWLNTSKDHVVGIKQKASAFWQRIAAYFAASPKVARGETRADIQCKQRWHKINDLVSKFCGAYAAATRQRTSGQNEVDTVKLAHEIFYNDQKIKFNLHHAWEELRNDQKWCEVASSKRDVRRKSVMMEHNQKALKQLPTSVMNQPTDLLALRQPKEPLVREASQIASQPLSIRPCCLLKRETWQRRRDFRRWVCLTGSLARKIL